jgi:hypothetical protein
MDAQRSYDVASSQPPLARLLRAVAALDGSSKLAMVCLLFGWFFMNTFVVSLGSLQHGVRFFDLSAVIADPTRMFFDGDTPGHRVGFGLVCVACLFAPLASHLVKGRHAWLGYVLPLALILVCGVLLYWRTSGELFTPPEDAKSWSGSLIHFANDLVHRGTDLVSRHVAIGAGSYLSFIGGAVLAVQGVRLAARERHAAR